MNDEYSEFCQAQGEKTGNSAWYKQRYLYEQAENLHIAAKFAFDEIDAYLDLCDTPAQRKREWDAAFAYYYSLREKAKLASHAQFEHYYSLWNVASV